MDHKRQFLQSEEIWEKDLRARYPESGDKTKEEYTNYQDPQRDTVREFYRLNHLNQTQHLLQTSEAIRTDGHPDSTDPRFNSEYGVYEPNCGLDNVHMSWGHDEYLYQVFKEYLPEPSQYMIRYHSFYAQHRKNAYDHLMNQQDHKMFKWVQMFNPYDLYSKSPVAPDVNALRPYYEDLASKYLPDVIDFN